MKYLLYLDTNFKYTTMEDYLDALLEAWYPELKIQEN